VQAQQLAKVPSFQQRLTDQRDEERGVYKVATLARPPETAHLFCSGAARSEIGGPNGTRVLGDATQRMPQYKRRHGQVRQQQFAAPLAAAPVMDVDSLSAVLGGMGLGTADGANAPPSPSAEASVEDAAANAVVGLRRLRNSGLTARSQPAAKPRRQRSAKYYVTPSGKKYHVLGCRYLGSERQPMPAAGMGKYEPCQHCVGK
jgi:hypothetical protein